MNINDYVLTSKGKIGLLTKLPVFKAVKDEKIILESNIKKEILDLIEKDKDLHLVEEAAEVFFNKNNYKIYDNQLSELKDINIKILGSDGRYVKMTLAQNDEFKKLIETMKANDIVFYLVK